MYTIQSPFSDRKIRTILRKLVFKNGRLRCPHCRCFKIKSIRQEDRWYCTRCRKRFSLTAHTWLKQVKIPLPLFIVLLSFWLEDVTVDLAAKLTSISRPTVYRYYRLFRRNIVKTATFKPEKNVQVDEAYFGQFKKQANYFHGKRTYKVVEKVCVAGISCPSTGQLATMVVEGKPGNPIKEFIRRQVPKDVWVYSDGSPIYTYLRNDYFHIAKTHDLGFENAYYIESCWSWMKRKLFKQYHHFTRKYAPEYVSELTFKFNTRRLTKNPLYYLQNSL